MFVLSRLENIYVSLYGRKEFAALPKFIGSSQFLQKIDKDRARAVQKELERLDELRSNVLSNTCAHIDVVRAFYSAKNDDEQRLAYDRIVAEFRRTPQSAKSRTDDTDIERGVEICKVCGYDLMCSHWFTLMTTRITVEQRSRELHRNLLTAAGPSAYVRMRDALTSYVNKDIRDVDTTYCKICGEQLYIIDTASEIDRYVEMPDDDRKILWMEARIILNKFCRIAQLINTESIIRDMIRASYSTIVQIMRQNISADKYTMRLAQLARTHYAAYLSILARRTKAIVFDMPAYEKSLSMRSRRADIAIIKMLSSKFANSVTGAQYTEIRDDTFDRLDNDPLLYTFSLLADVPRNAALAQKLALIAKPAQSGPYLPGARAYSSIPSIPRLADQKKAPQDEQGVAALYYDYSRASFNEVIDWYCARDSKQAPAESTAATSSIAVPTHSPYVAKMAEFFDNLMMIERRAPVTHMRNAYDNRFQRDHKISLAYAYNAEGKKHKWDSYVMPDGTIATVKDFAEGKYTPKSYVDFYSGNTRTQYTKIDTASVDKITEALDFVNNVESFFNFYINYCPEGYGSESNGAMSRSPKHARKTAQDRCSKCGVRINMSKDDRTTYYLKYKTVYERKKTEQFDLITKMAMRDEDRKTHEYEFKQPEHIELKDSAIKFLADQLTVEPIAIKYLGAMQGLLYRDVVYGTVTPPIPKNVFSPQLVMLDSYILNFYAQQGQHGHRDAASAKKYLDGRDYHLTRISDDVAASEKHAIAVRSWMLAYFIEVSTTYVSEEPRIAKNILQQIMRSDMLLCRNTIVDVDEEVSLDDVDETTVDIEAIYGEKTNNRSKTAAQQQYVGTFDYVFV
jgi:hypothetical protein